MEGRLFERPVAEQARMLLRKAKKAAQVCRENGGRQPFGFSQILGEGGKVVESLPAERLVVNLGREVDVREGQRFLAWSPDADPAGTNGDRRSPAYKGELIVMETGERQSLAEIIHHADPAWPIGPGDRLTLLSERGGQADPAARDAGANGDEAKRDPLTGLYSYRAFLRRWTRERENCARFALALVRLEGDVAGADDVHANAGQRAAEAADLAARVLGEKALGGRHGLGSLIYFVPDADQAGAMRAFNELHRRIGEELGVEAVIGAYCHPFLNYRMADAPDNARKALEYAALLPPPRVGLFDSLAVTISADRLFSRGDLYGAIEEYKIALLADEGNNLARNSLGICQARLGRLLEARNLFEEAVRRDPADVMALYNLGFACHKLAEDDEARAAYLRCLELQPGHLFAHIRLGRLAERAGDLPAARRRYETAAAIEGGQGITRRYLARLALLEGDAEGARELLHQALIHDPRDAASLHLMAKICLDAGDDPEVAEAFARQSAALSPANKAFWLELARACEATGKTADASAAMAKAMAL
jgi:tetratricopeptide (TPR) repeat protein